MTILTLLRIFSLAVILLFPVNEARPQGFSTASPAREYIYLGDRLIASRSPLNQAPSLATYTGPASPGAGGVFDFMVRDPNGARNVGQIVFLLNKQLSGWEGCYFFYSALDNSLYLSNGVQPQTWSQLPMSPSVPTPAYVESAYCRIDKPGSSAGVSPSVATDFLVRANITLKSTLTGTLNVYVLAYDLEMNTMQWQTLGVYVHP